MLSNSRWIAFPAVLVWITLLSGRICCGQNESPQPAFPDFKIESQVFIDRDHTPVCINQTMFNAGLVIDLQFKNGANHPSEICIYDSRNRKFILLNIEKQIRLNVDQLQLLRIAEAMKQELRNSETTQALVFENFEEDFQQKGNIVSVSNGVVSYVSRGIRPSVDSILVPYYEFLDQYAMIAVTDPQRMPPFARLKLNQTIKKYGLVPASIELTVKSGNSNRANVEASSQHTISMSLTSQDLDRIKFAKKSWTQFRQVELPEYLNASVASRDTLSRKR